MKNVIFIFLTVVLFSSCEKRNKIHPLNSIFLNINLQDNYKQIVEDSRFDFEKKKLLSNPFDKNTSELEIYDLLIKSNPYFKSKVKKGYISILPSNKDYSINQIIEFEDSKNMRKEYENLKSVLAPLAQDTITIKKPVPYTSTLRFDHFLIKLKEEYNSGFIEINSNNGDNCIVIVYNTNPKSTYVMDLYVKNRKSKIK